MANAPRTFWGDLRAAPTNPADTLGITRAGVFLFRFHLGRPLRPERALRVVARGGRKNIRGIDTAFKEFKPPYVIGKYLPR